MSRAMVVGGSNGIGLAFVHELLNRGYSSVVIADRSEPQIVDNRVEYLKINLVSCKYDAFDNYKDIDALIITAGFGRTALFETITEKEIENSFNVNSKAPITIISKYYDKLASNENFNCLVVASIAGLVSSPLFSVYSATKAALCKFIEAVNIELEKKGTSNRIMNVSPGSLRGTKFNGGENDISVLSDLVSSLVDKMKSKCELFIPDYESVYKGVISRYNTDSHKFGLDSYEYKIKSGRINNNPQIKIGYLSGTFDLFHIGHLNLLRRAKEYCDYLVVGVHKDASHKGKEVFIPYKERVEILKSISYVDKVIPSKPEDMDVYSDIQYDYLFVGSDYKGSERFNRYEQFFADKDTEIVYFPYTKETNSTQLRRAIEMKQGE